MATVPLRIFVARAEVVVPEYCTENSKPRHVRQYSSSTFSEHSLVDVEMSFSRDFVSSSHSVIPALRVRNMLRDK